MIYVWKLDKLIFPAWVSNICIKPWIGLQMFINCVCHNSVKPSKQASGRSILGRDTIWGGGGRSTRREGRPRRCFMMADRYVVWSMGPTASASAYRPWEGEMVLPLFHVLQRRRCAFLLWSTRNWHMPLLTNFARQSHTVGITVEVRAFKTVMNMEGEVKITGT